MFLLPTTLVAFDLETTGLSPVKDEIIEIGAVKFSFHKVGERMEILEKGTFQSLVKPDRHIPEEATRVNHITDAMVQDAPVAKDVLPNFLRFCGQSSLLVAHNGHAFDAPFLREACKKAGIATPRLPVMDSLKISRNLMRESASHKLSDIAGRMVASGEIRIRLEQGELHRALYDCQVLAQVVGRLVLKSLPEKDLAIDRFQKAAEKLAPIAMLEN
jgi:DNA polymerase III epsilon subunit family exonuclease